MKKLLLLFACMAAGCHEKPAKIDVKTSDGAQFAVTLPQGLTAAEMIQLRGMADNVLTIRAESDRYAYEMRAAAAQQAAQTQARRDYLWCVTVWFGMGSLVVCYFFGRRGVRA